MDEKFDSENFDDKPEQKECTQELLKKYHAEKLFNFLSACRINDAEVIKAHLESGLHPKLNENLYYAMPPGFLQELPLAIAVKQNALETVLLLLEHGADPDALCRKNEKTPRELAADKPEIWKLF